MMSITSRVLHRFISGTFDSLHRELPAARYLEIGCGDLRYRKYLESLGWSCLFTDLEFRSAVGVSALVDAQALPFPDATFDVIMMTEVLEHVPDIGKALTEVSRALKPAGYLVVTFPFNYGMHEIPRDFRRWTEFNAIAQFEKVGLETKTFERRGDAVAVVLTIAVQLMRGALEALRRKPLLKPLYLLCLPIVLGATAVMVQSYVLFWLRVFAPHRCVRAGDGLSGMRGHLNLWHLGYQFICQKRQ
jgi:SAM-dependent methyltransferase